MNDTVIIKDLDSSDDLLSQSSKHYSEMEEVTSPKGSCNQEEGSPKVTSLMCSNCKTTKTPLWRRAPDGTIMCNACGLYLKTRSSLRPSWLKKPENLENPNNDCEGTCQGSGQCNGTGGSSSCGGCPVYNQSHQAKRETVCSNCGSTTTPLWRRDEEGKTICNACGLYYKLHKVHRPVSLKKSVIKRRKRLLVGNKRINTFPSTEAPSAAASNANVNTQPSQLPVPANKPAAEQPTPSTKPNNRPNQPIFKVKRNMNPVVLSKPLTVEVPAIEDYLGPKKKTADSLIGSDKKSAAKRTIEEDTDVHYSPIKITARKAPAPVSYPPIQTQYKSVSPPSAHNTARSSYRPPAQSPQPSYIHHSPHSHHHEPTSPSFSSTSLPPMVNSGFSSSSSSSSLSYHSPQTTQPNQRLTLPSIREVYPQFPQHTQVTQPSNLISSPIVDSQKNTDSLDRDALAAHKRDLQIQMANLSQMLQSTSALLSGIDKALSSDR